MKTLAIICIVLNILLFQQSSFASHIPETRIDGKSVQIAGRCYYFARFESVTYDQAMENCANDTVTPYGMVLASFETQEENDAVMMAISQQPELDFWMWTSGVRAAGNPIWKWNIDGVTIPLEYDAWMDGAPMEAIIDKACINFSVTAGGWDDDLCDVAMSYLCEEEGDESLGCI